MSKEKKVIVSVTLDPEIWTKSKDLAEQQDISFSMYVNDLLRKQVKSTS